MRCRRLATNTVESGLQRQGCAGEVRFFAGNGSLQEGDDDRWGQIRLEQEVFLVLFLVALLADKGSYRLAKRR
jgi:hypothetical protein